MGFKYTGKPLTKRQVDAHLKRIYLKPTAMYEISPRTGKFVKKKRRKR